MDYGIQKNIKDVKHVKDTPTNTSPAEPHPFFIYVKTIYIYIYLIKQKMSLAAFPLINVLQDWRSASFGRGDTFTCGG